MEALHGFSIRPIKVPLTNGPIDNQIEVSVSAHGHKGPGFTLGYNPREQRIQGGLPNGSSTVVSCWPEWTNTERVVVVAMPQ